MADKRMFSQKIIDSDAFLDMPTSAQALYFHLGMRADDDGFVNNPKKIRNFVGAADDDLKLLIAKNFLIPFDSGVVVIKHWRIHNYIQKDHYKPTTYTAEKAQLELKENNAYTLASETDNKRIPNGEQLDNNWIPNGEQLDAQNKLGKSRIGEIKLGEGEDIYDEPPADALIAYAANNLQYLSPDNVTELDSFRDSLTDEMIRYAINEACANGARNYAYARKILNRMVDRGFKTLGEVKAAEAERKAKQTAPVNVDPAVAQNLRKAQYTRRPMDERTDSGEDDVNAMYRELMNRPRSGGAA